METRILVDGEWVTRRVDVETVLRHHDAQDNLQMAEEVAMERPPFMSILTQTVVQSPLVHHVLPIKLRGLEYNDVAFIGEDFVQIREVRSDGFLWDVVRKANFGARIRNACVVGSIEDYQVDIDAMSYDGPFKYAGPVLPPQFLLLQFDNGESVFMMLQQCPGKDPELVITSRYKAMRSMLDTQPGMYLGVDPSSRYIAVACSELQLLICELRSRQELQARYTQGLSIEHVKADTYIPFQGVVQNMAFLYPSADMVVLLLLVVAKGRTRMVIFEWNTGIEVHRIRALTSRGHLLPPQHQMPLLLIPLRFKSSFILVSENVMAIFENILEGAPDCTPFYDRTDPPTQHHGGNGSPLWVSWARPTYRTRAHTDHRDDIYIAREDGLLKFLEIDSECDDFVENDIDVGDFEGRCGATLACIDYRTANKVTGDLLITGGDSCRGGCYLVQARETPTLIQPIENWTPVQDIVRVSRVPRSHSSRRFTTAGPGVPTPDRLFACVGKGSKGAITEFRHGIEARIGLQFDCEIPIMQAWALPFDRVAQSEFGGMLFLLSIGASSIALRLASDESSVETIEQDILKLDLVHHTVEVALIKDRVIQATEKSITVASEQSRITFEADQLFHVQEHGNTIGLGDGIHLAAIEDDFVLYTTVIDHTTYLLQLSINFEKNLDMGGEQLQDARNLTHFSGEVTAIAVCNYLGKMFAVIAESGDDNDFSCLKIKGLNDEDLSKSFNLATVEDHGLNTAIVESIARDTHDESFSLLCGLRSGSVIRLLIEFDKLELQTWEVLRLGTGPVTIQRHRIVDAEACVIANCDNKTFFLGVGERPKSTQGQSSTHQLWYTDASDPGLSPPEITSIAGFTPDIGMGSPARLLVVAGSQLLLTSVDIVPKTVPRHIEIQGTPTRMLYSKSLDALVVAGSINNRSTILFIDPDTGEDLTCALDSRRGKKVQYGSGLGKTDDRFFRLIEWKYEKDNKTWDFIIACTSSGKQLIISAESILEDSFERPGSHGTSNINNDLPKRKISYFTRHIFKSQEPIYSVAGFSQGLLWCAGEKLYCDILELSDRKFRRVAEYDLPSLARDLQYSNGKIYVLTQEHSLQILELVHDKDQYKIQYQTSDRLSRITLDHALIAPSSNHPSLHLVSDKLRSIVGLWPTHDAIVDTLETVFEGQVPESILKFLPTSCRPLWDPCWLTDTMKTKRLMPLDAARSQELLGLSICGSITRFVALRYEAWAFLRFLVDLCLRCKEVCELNYTDDPLSLDFETEPKLVRHIDGDILKKCLEGRKLEAMLATPHVDLDSIDIMKRFKELVVAVHGNSLVQNHGDAAYVEQAYSDLELYLRPVL